MIKALITIILFLSSMAQADQIRLKDLVSIDGVRGNDLIGYGLVVGLNGTGDAIRNAPFTEDIMANLLERLGVNVAGEDYRPKNAAAVFVTATLPPFARAGSTIDVTVSAIGDAKSLLGGTLIMTPLNGADGEVYAVAQGAIIASGVSAEGNAARIVQGVPTVGNIPSGARVEREVEFDFSTVASLRLALKNPDFTTASRIERVVNRALGGRIARMMDAGTVTLDLSQNSASPAHLLASIEGLEITPETLARVVIDQRAGTIVMGDDVRISRVAVAQGNLTLKVEEAPMVVQPNPFAQGDTVVVPRSNADIIKEGTGLAVVPNSTDLSQVVAGLNALGVGPYDMIDILKSIHAAGALHAELVIQ